MSNVYSILPAQNSREELSVLTSLRPSHGARSGNGTLAIVLGGGGGKCGAHLGVLSVLESLRLPIDLLVGSSMGGVIGALYAAGYAIDDIIHRLSSSSIWRLLERDATGTALLGNKGMRSTLEEMFGECTFDQLEIPCAVMAVDLITGNEVVLDSGPLVDALMATMAFPALFPPVQRDAMLLIDGGTINNLPVDVAYARGADKVIAVDLGVVCDNFQLEAGSASAFDFRNMLLHRPLAMANRSLSLMMAHITRCRLAENPPDLLLCPEVEQIGLLELARVGEGYAAGAEAALEAMDDLLALHDWRLGETASFISTEDFLIPAPSLEETAIAA